MIHTYHNHRLYVTIMRKRQVTKGLVDVPKERRARMNCD